MDTKESIQKEMQDIEQCPTREICPFGTICGTSRSEQGKPLLPRVLPVEKGDKIWTSLRFDSQVLVVRKGVFVTMGLTELEESIPFELLGKGNTAGLTELYTPPEISDYYHIRNIIQGEVCSLSTKVLRRKLEESPIRTAHQIISCAFVSQAAAAFTHTKIISKKTLYGRIFALLLYLQDVTGRQDTELNALEITHEEIAMLVASDRVSTTRVLHKMCDEGIIAMGYKLIAIHNDKLVEHAKNFEAHSFFFTLKEESEHLRDASIRAPYIDRDGDPYLIL